MLNILIETFPTEISQLLGTTTTQSEQYEHHLCWDIIQHVKTSCSSLDLNKLDPSFELHIEPNESRYAPRISQHLAFHFVYKNKSI